MSEATTDPSEQCARSSFDPVGKSFGTFGYRSFVLMSLTIVYTFNFIDRILISVVAVPIINEFQLSQFQFGLLSGIGFALFYMKGAAGDLVSMREIYRGIVPFVMLQVAVLFILIWQPELAMWLPNKVLDH